MGTVYSVAFSGNEFLMVYNPKRKGWEMPGGHMEVGESVEYAAKREFREESGYDIKIMAIKELDDCIVCACLLNGRVSDNAEMECRMFRDLPAELAFGKKEYESVIPWARSVLFGPI